MSFNESVAIAAGGMGNVPARRFSGVRRSSRFLARRPLAAFSLVVLVILVTVAALAPLIAPYDPITTDPAARLSGPSADHLFGADGLGRDIFSQTVYGARVSLVVGLLAAGLGTLAGSLVGLVGAYVGGVVDTILQLIMDAIMAIPAIVFLLLIGAISGQSLWHVVWALSAVIVPYASRVVRGSALAVREAPYVESARVAGAGPLRVIFVHILPNVMPIIIITASILVGSAMLTEGALSFLGLGIPADDPTWKTSWGIMLSPDKLRYLEQAPLLTLYPGIALTLAVLAFNLLGDTLRDVLDPRLRGT